MLIADGTAKPWSIVTDVHGAPGISGWKQLVPGLTLRGAWEAVELARIPPGGLSGLHRHTRTHELYLALAGSGEYLIDGRSEPFEAGRLAVTAVGSVHGLRNGGTDDVSWLVVEVPCRTPSYPLTPREVTVDRSLGPVDLDRIGRLDLTSHGLEPLRQVGMDRLVAGESRDLTTDDGEFFGYLVDGAAEVRTADGAVTFPVGPGTGITLARGERARLTATEAGRLFWVRSGLPDEQP